MIYNFIKIIKLSIQKVLRHEIAVANKKDIQSRREICNSCEFITGKFKINYRCISCNCNISTKVIFTTSECPEGKWGTLDY